MRREYKKRLTNAELKAMGLTLDLVTRKVRGPERSQKVPDARKTVNFLKKIPTLKIGQIDNDH